MFAAEGMKRSEIKMPQVKKLVQSSAVFLLFPVFFEPIFFFSDGHSFFANITTTPMSLAAKHKTAVAKNNLSPLSDIELHRKFTLNKHVSF